MSPEVRYNAHDIYPDIPDVEIYMKTVMFPLKDSDGNITNYIFMYEDITKQKKFEKELEKLRKELENRVKYRTIKLENSEKKYRKAYKRANCFKGLFTHDVSNLFQIISNSIELWQIKLKQGIEIKEVFYDLQLIEQSIARGKKLINNIRNLSEMEESEMPLEAIEVLENLKNAIQFIKVNFQKRNIKINIISDKQIIYVIANELLLDVFENILTNAVTYNEKPIVQIDINISNIRENDEEYIKIEFKDNGIGIEDSRKQILFKESHLTCKKSKGMGLGISLVAKLVELCEGKIWVEDRVKGDFSQGSNFVVLVLHEKK